MLSRKFSILFHVRRRVAGSFASLAGIAMLALPFWGPAYAQDAGIGKLAVVGDSLSAGFQNGTLIGCQQVNGYANLIAKQAGVEQQFVLPLITLPGLPPLPNVAGIPGREDPGAQTFDLAVPGQTANQALTMIPDFSDGVFQKNVPPPAGVQAMADFILGFPGVFTNTALSQVGWVQALKPNTLIVWLGSNDAIGVFEGLQPQITNPVDFARNFEQVMQSVTAQGRRVIVANVPDATLTPALQGASPLQKLQLRALIIAYNAAIALIAPKYGAPVVDIYTYVNLLAAHGVTVLGQHLTTQANGGLFSLDGLHPTNTGYALIANQFIQTMHQRLGTNIPVVNIGEVAAADPLFPRNVGSIPLCIPH